MLITILFLVKLFLTSAQSDGGDVSLCLSALNSTETTLETVEEGIYLFVTPTDDRVPQETTLEFLCCYLTSVVGASTPDWNVIPRTSGRYLSIGSDGRHRIGERKLFYAQMTLVAVPNVNGTEVKCVQDIFISNSRTLFVVGPPSPPVPTLNITQESVTVRWDPVFSWPEYPVTGYQVQLFRFSQEQPLITDRLANSTELSISQELVRRFSNQLEECEELTFSVRAINSIGQGEAGNITGGLPMQNGLMAYNSTVKANVIFNSHFQPEIQFELPVPTLCSYQKLDYSFIVTDQKKLNDTLSSFHGQITIRELNELLLIVDPKMSFAMESFYTVYAILVTEDGETISTVPPTKFSTITKSIPCKRFADGGSQPPEIVVYTLAAVCAGLLIIVVMTICGLCIQKGCCCIKRKRTRSNLMVDNPIYAGPIYDSVYDSRGRLLASNVSTPSTVGTPDFPPPNSIKQLENSLMEEFNQPKHPLEPRYSSSTPAAATTDSAANADLYVKMKGKVVTEEGGRGTTSFETETNGALIDFDFVKVSDV